MREPRRRFTKREIADVYRKSGGRCRECKTLHRLEDYPRTWNVDHVILHSKGGSNSNYNLAVTCRDCNSKRGNSENVGDVAEVAARRALQMEREDGGGRSRNVGQRDGGRSGGGTSGRNRRSSGGGGGRSRCRNCGNPVKPGFQYCRDCGCRWRGCRRMAEVNMLGALLEYCSRHMDESIYGPPARWPGF